jgi:hypothetical protein
MPKGPRGEKRPADAIGLAVMIGKIATGEIEDERTNSSRAAGGNAKAARSTPAQRLALAQKAAKARWGT